MSTTVLASGSRFKSMASTWKLKFVEVEGSRCKHINGGEGRRKKSAAIVVALFVSFSEFRGSLTQHRWDFMRRP